MDTTVLVLTLTLAFLCLILVFRFDAKLRECETLEAVLKREQKNSMDWCNKYTELRDALKKDENETSKLRRELISALQKLAAVERALNQEEE